MSTINEKVLKNGNNNYTFPYKLKKLLTLQSNTVCILASWSSQHGPEPLLPGLQYSQAQMFWISAASVWCAKYRDKALKLRVLTGVHSPDMFRVQVTNNILNHGYHHYHLSFQGPFSNMEEFSRDFNCPIGSKMNPKSSKCSVW